MAESADDIVETYGITILLATLLVGWYELQLVVLTVYGPDVFQWWMTFESVTQPTLGWVLATLSHGGLNHLGVNVVFLLVFGGFAEPHLGRRQYLVFFFMVGFAASFANLVFWPADGPSVGASGAVFGLGGYVMYHLVRHHEETLYLSNYEENGVLGPERRLFRTLMIVIGFPWIIIQVSLEIVGVIPSGKAAVGAHAFGFLFGVLYEYWQPFVGGKRCEE